MSEKKQVFFSFVGKRDPFDESNHFVASGKKTFAGRLSCLFSGCSCRIEKTPDKKSEGSILTLCREIRPDIIYLFPSAEGQSTTMHNAEIVKKELTKILPNTQCSIFPLNGNDPTDFEDLSREFREKLGRIASELGELQNFSYHINCSSGTQQMAAIAYVFASGGMFPAVQRWQCRDPRFSGDRVQRIDTNFLEEHTIIEKIKRNLDAYAFTTIADDCALLSNKTTTPQRREIALFFAEVFKAYSYQDTLRYQEAYITLKNSLKGMSSFLDAESLAILQSQVAALKELLSGNIAETPENLIDLYFNMLRCYERGAYADVLSRFWRVGEGCVYYRLASHWGINPREIFNSPSKEHLELLRRHPDFQNRLPKNMEFKRGRQILREYFEDRDYIELWEKYTKKKVKFNKSFSDNKIQSIIEKRNDTIVAHGMKPVTEEYAQESLEISEVMLLSLLPDAERRMADFPFKKDTLKKFVLLLEKP